MDFENLNYIDVGLLALLVLSLLFGLFGKAPKKIWKFIIVAGSVVFAYIFTDKVIDAVLTAEVTAIPVIGSGQAAGTTLLQYVNSYVSGLMTANGITLSVSAVEGLVTGLLKVFVFWLLCIGAFIAFGIVGGIIGSIFFSHAAKGTAIKTIGIFSVLKTAIVLVALLFPVFVLSPIIENVDTLTAFAPELAGNETVALVQKQFIGDGTEENQGSKVIRFTDGLLGYRELEAGEDDFLIWIRDLCPEKPIGANIGVLKYTMDDSGEEEDSEETTCYTCNDIKSLPGLLELASKFTSTTEGESSNPIEIITNMSDEDIAELFSNIENSPAVKEVLVSVVEGMLPDDVDIDLSEIDLSEEADTFIAVKDVMTSMDNGEDLTTEDVTELVDAIADSGMVAALAEANPGVLNSLDQDTQDEIKDQLADKLADGEDAGGISQEQYDSLMKLFGTTSSED